MGADNILRRCALEHERPRILAKAHEGIAGGHYAGKLPRTRYCVQDYGGQLFIEMQRNIVKDAMFVRGLVNQTDRMRCPYIHK
jgi:hypothetical protein